jgi:hypothetical protein
MNWVSSSIDAETVFDCPHCGGSLIPGLAFCRHVVFYLSVDVKHKISITRNLSDLEEVHIPKGPVPSGLVK